MSSSILQPHVDEIEKLSSEIQRLNKRLKDLRKWKKDAQNNLYNEMKYSNTQVYGKYKLSTLEPKPPRKTQKEKKECAIHFLEQSGISNAEAFWEKLKEATK